MGVQKGRHKGPFKHKWIGPQHGPPPSNNPWIKSSYPYVPPPLPYPGETTAWQPHPKDGWNWKLIAGLVLAAGGSAALLHKMSNIAQNRVAKYNEDLVEFDPIKSKQNLDQATRSIVKQVQYPKSGAQWAKAHQQMRDKGKGIVQRPVDPTQKYDL